MSKIQEAIKKLFNQIFRKNKNPMISSISKQNYDEYKKTYYTLSKISKIIEGMDAYLIGGISAAIQTNHNLYRKNDDLDIMCKEENLHQLVQSLKKIGYTVEDRRDIKTRNMVDISGNFIPADHEINADTRNKKMLGVGIFTYKQILNEIIIHSYAYHEKEGKVIATEKIMPKELFDLIYKNEAVDYKGIKLKTQSKEYTYLTKSKGKREKDKLDASIIEPTLDEESRAKMQRIKELEAKTKTYKIIYSKDGKIESRKQTPTLEDKVNTYLNSLYMMNTTKTPEEIVKDVKQIDNYHKISEEHPEIDKLINNWKENKTINNTENNTKKEIKLQKIKGFVQNK